MTITITLPPDVEAALRAEALAQDRDVADVAADRLAAAYAVAGAPPVPEVADDDAEGYAALVAGGDADFAAGRFKSYEAVREAASRRRGIAL